MCSSARDAVTTVNWTSITSFVWWEVGLTIQVGFTDPE